MSKHAQVQRASSTSWSSATGRRPVHRLHLFIGNPCKRISPNLFLLLRTRDKTVSVAKLTMDTVSRANFLIPDMCKMKANYNQMRTGGSKRSSPKVGEQWQGLWCGSSAPSAPSLGRTRCAALAWDYTAEPCSRHSACPGITCCTENTAPALPGV